MVKDMRTWIDQLQQLGELVCINDEVEIGDIGAFCYHSRERALLFENIKGYGRWKALAQAPASMRHMALALGVSGDQLIQHVASCVGKSLLGLKEVYDAPCKERVFKGNSINLTSMPVHKHNEQDGGLYIGAGLAIVKDPETGIQNLAFHRMMLKGEGKTGFRMAPRHTWRVYKKYAEQGMPMPTAVVIGHHPALYLAAAITGSPDMCELELAGSLMGRPLEVVKAETTDLMVPAYSEMVIEGRVMPGITEEEGPFGEYTGCYSAGKSQSQVFEVDVITMRNDAIYKICQSGTCSEAAIYHWLPISVVLYNRMIGVGGGIQVHNIRALPGSMCYVTQVTPSYEGHAKTALLAALSSENDMPKFIIAVDKDIDIYDLEDVFWALSTRVDPSKDIIVLPNVRIHHYDPMLIKYSKDYQEVKWPLMSVGCKMAIDATSPVVDTSKRKRFEKVLPASLKNESIIKLIKGF